jgi:ribonuclease HII
VHFQEITQFERNLYNKGIKYIAGIDEVGRGPLAGPFVVSAVILDLDKIFSKELEYLINDVQSIEKESEAWCYYQINDSKLVSAKKRDVLADFIKKEAVSYSIVSFSPEKVDELGISEITQLAFYNAVKNLKIKPEKVFTDTFEIKKLTQEDQTNIISGDKKSISIAAASIIAKVYRDKIMIEEHLKYPVYGFDKHKGYGTKFHLEALYEYGPCEIHRKSFHPVKGLLRRLTDNN